MQVVRRASLLFLLVWACSGGEDRDPLPPTDDADTDDADTSMGDRNECRDSDGDELYALYDRETGEPAVGPPCDREDCDDTNPRRGGAEICDEIDNDCDGLTDDGVRQVGSTCIGDREEHVGGGHGAEPWGVEVDGSTSEGVRARGVEVDPDGAVRLISMRNVRDFIWLADTAHNWHSVSKYSTQSPFELQGRYCLAPPPMGSTEPCGDADPSRTSVDLYGNVYVADRNGGRVIKILSAGEACPDTNHDMQITTWQPNLDGDDDPTNDPPLPWGQDDCIVWVTDLQTPENGGSDARGIAAQEVEGPDGEIEQYVWVGGMGGGPIFKLDGLTGEVVLKTEAPAGMYGMALDGFGQLWMTVSGSLGRLDTTRCLTEESCSDPVCATGTVEDDACVKQTITNLPCGSYGITVDSQSRVWLGGQGMSRYDPRAEFGMRWAAVPAGLDTCTGEFCDVTRCGNVSIGGIAADGSGSVWGSGGGQGVVRADANRPSVWAIVEGTEGSDCVVTDPAGVDDDDGMDDVHEECSSKGMAVDLFGHVWSVNSGDTASVITAGPEVDNNIVRHGVAYLPGASRYTYSDMTGIQLRLATNAIGYYQRIFLPCGEGNDANTMFKTLAAEIEAPDGTYIVWSFRVARHLDELVDAEWIEAGRSSADETIDLAALFADAGVEGRYIEVRAGFRTTVRSIRSVVSPLLQGITLTSACEIELM